MPSVMVALACTSDAKLLLQYAKIFLPFNDTIMAR